MKNTIKLGIIAICLSFCISCAHHNPAATPAEVNDYLSDICHIAADYGYSSALECKSRIEMQSKLRGMLINRKVNF